MVSDREQVDRTMGAIAHDPDLMAYFVRLFEELRRANAIPVELPFGGRVGVKGIV